MLKDYHKQMGILNFVKPDKIVLQKATDFEAQFEFRPLEPGYGAVHLRHPQWNSHR